MNYAKIKWYIYRFSSFTLSEILFRLEKIISERIAYYSFKLKKSGRGQQKIGDFTSVTTEFPHFFDLNKRNLNIWNFRKNIREALYRASLICENQIWLFKKEFNFGEKIEWQQDPQTHNIWPNNFWSKVDTRDGSTVGGVKWVWELNRHHHLVTLGKAYLLTGDEKYAEQVLAQVLDWIENNPRYVGVNWTSPLELSIRLINWIWALAFIHPSPALTPENFQYILKSIDEQTNHIARHLSAYSSANNHLIGEAAGLAIVGMTFPQLPQAEEWRKRGFQILEQELEKQIYADGVPAEQTVHYLAFVLDFNLLVWLLAEVNGHPVPEIWPKRFSAACEFLSAIMDEAGNIPDIGDRDDGWVVKLDDRQEANNYRSILAAASVILERPDFKWAAREWDEKSHWLLGENGRWKFENMLEEVKQPISQTFSEGGYCVMRDRDRVIVLDCGPLGYLSTAGHGHADALSLNISIGGHPVLIDPGTYAYQEGDQYRDYFRSTFAHNTIAIDGYNQSEMVGTFLWKSKAKSRLSHWETTSGFDLAIADHDGFRKYGVIHERIVYFSKPDYLLVVDRLLGRGRHKYYISWHFPHQSNIEHGKHTRIVTQECEMSIINIGDRMRPDVQMGEREPLQGWMSPSYGVLVEAPVLVREDEILLPAELVTGMYFGRIHGMGTQVDLERKFEDMIQELIVKGHL